MTALRDEPGRAPFGGVPSWTAPVYDVDDCLIPLPLWARRGFDHDGPDAWSIVRRDLAEADPVTWCVYLHVPFCSRKCQFCDCYSFRLSPVREPEVDRYTDRLCAELRLWAAQGRAAERPVSTVHLGGGTPTFLTPGQLARVVGCLRERYFVSPDTEWALESTVEGLSPAMVEAMAGLGFTRLHLGVQTLQDDVRRIIGRRNPAADVLDAIARARALGWIVSVDLVCGLPGQVAEGFVADVNTLVDAGIEGASLYELLVYPQNRAWAERTGVTGRSHLPNYLMFEAAAAALEGRGFVKNTFNHWARGRDDNRYFTFPARAEDCLAVGTIADGVISDYHVRHPRYAPYLRSAPETPGLAGGLRRTALEQRLHPLETAVLSGDIDTATVRAIDDNPAGVALSRRWGEAGLVRSEPDGGLALTTRGSWFAGNLIGELTAAHRG